MATRQLVTLLPGVLYSRMPELNRTNTQERSKLIDFQQTDIMLTAQLEGAAAVDPNCLFFGREIHHFGIEQIVQQTLRVEVDITTPAFNNIFLAINRTGSINHTTIDLKDIQQGIMIFCRKHPFTDRNLSVIQKARDTTVR